MLPSIYIKPPSPDLSGLKFKDQILSRIAVFATELRTVERLIVMGWEKAGGLVLTQHQSWLEKRISELEAVLK